MSLRPLWSLFSVRLFSPVYSVGVASWSWRNFISPCCVCVYTQDNKNISDRVTVFHQNTPTFLLAVFISRNFSLAHRLWFELRLYSLCCSDLPPLVSLFLPELPEHSHRRWPKRNKLTLSPRFTTERLAPTEHNASTIVILFKSGDLNLAELRELSHRREINAAQWGQINLIMPGSWVKLKQTSTMRCDQTLFCHLVQGYGMKSRFVRDNCDTRRTERQQGHRTNRKMQKQPDGPRLSIS